MGGRQGHHGPSAAIPAGRRQSNGSVRIKQFAAVGQRPAHRLVHLGSVDTGGGEEPGSRDALIFGQRHALCCFKLRHARRQGSAVAPGQIEQQPLEIGGHLNIHRRCIGGPHRTGAVITGRQRAVQDVILVRRHHKAFDGQAHLRRDITRKHIAEIAGWHGIGNGPVRRPKRQS